MDFGTKLCVYAATAASVVRCRSFFLSVQTAFLVVLITMSYVIAAISNSGGAPEQAYRKMQSAGACPERPFAGKSIERNF